MSLRWQFLKKDPKILSECDQTLCVVGEEKEKVNGCSKAKHQSDQGDGGIRSEVGSRFPSSNVLGAAENNTSSPLKQLSLVRCFQYCAKLD